MTARAVCLCVSGNEKVVRGGRGGEGKGEGGRGGRGGHHYSKGTCCYPMRNNRAIFCDTVLSTGPRRLSLFCFCFTVVGGVAVVTAASAVVGLGR